MLHMLNETHLAHVLATPRSAPLSRAAPPSTSPIVEGEAGRPASVPPSTRTSTGRGDLRLALHLGVHLAVDVPLTSACCKSMFQVFQKF
jgi:hypothetical protein